LWRDLKLGDQGADVEAVGAELKRLGWLSGAGSTTLTASVVKAWRQLASSLGVPAARLPSAAIPQALIVWLPAAEATVASCDGQVGGTITTSQPAVTFVAPVVAARLSGQLNQLTPGERSLVIDDQTSLTVDANGQITDPAALATLAVSPTVRLMQQAGLLDSLTGRYALATPLDLSVVPPAAIVTTGGSTGCVLADDSPRAVTIVASQLGQSFIQFDDGAAPPSTVLLNPPSTLTCS
jgi:hypothetical protein